MSADRPTISFYCVGEGTQVETGLTPSKDLAEFLANSRTSNSRGLNIQFISKADLDPTVLRKPSAERAKP